MEEEFAVHEPVAVEDIDPSDESSYDQDAGTLEAFVQERFDHAETARETEEIRWLQAYRNYRGLYGPDVQFTEAERSRIFIKVTKTKVLAAYNQITEVLFGANKFPITIDPTRLPEGVEETVHFETDPNLAQIGNAPEEASERLLPGETMEDLKNRLGALKKKLEPLEGNLKMGPGTTPTAVTLHPAMVSAKKMEKQIMDQLEESNARKELRMAAFEMALFGTGIMKGPFAVDKEYPDWDEQGNYKPVIKTMPKTKAVSIWNFYPDPDANNMEEAEYVIERHKMSRTDLRHLKKRPFFRKEAIDRAIRLGSNYIKDDWEQSMEDDRQESRTERYEVLEFWGNVETEMLIENGIDIPDEMGDLPQVSANIWICNGALLRCVLNPFTPAYIPYYAVPYEMNPYSMFGVGLGENMDDTQTLMNGFMRLAVDNAALSGNLVIEVDETNLTPGQNLTDFYPGKVIRRQGGAPGQALFGTKFPNVANENMQLFDKARQLADESTGFPSFAHGQTGVSGVGRTASGISMLMSAANGSIRTVVKNIDDYLLSPLGKAFFRFNMQFNHNPEIKGDLEVKAQGTESLMANEVRSQRLMQFLGVVQNPQLAPFAKTDYIIREIAKSLDLDPDKVTNSLSDAAIQAEILKKFQSTQEPPAGPEGGPPPPPGTNPTDPTGAGGGTVGTGQAPTPGEQGFTGGEG
jgi:hypothetical protein